MEMLTVNNVSKRFGSREIIRDLSFSVKEHTVYGFIGRNGAGKTTTMKMILGLYKADSGEIYVNGERVAYGQNSTNRYIGYLPDVPEYYGYMTPCEYLELCGRITGMEPEARKKKISSLIELVGLEKSDKRIRTFSRGMKQRLGIAQALLNEPRLLICDEPTSALDPLGRKEILDILSSIKERTTVIFSTHILSDVERICDEIGLLDNGRLCLETTMQSLRSINQSDGLEIDFADNEDAESFLGSFTHGYICERSGTSLVIKRDTGKGENTEDMMKNALRILAQESICPQRVELLEPTLEALFVRAVEKSRE